MEVLTHRMAAHCIVVFFVMNKDGSNIQDISGENMPAGTKDLYPQFSDKGAKIKFTYESNDGIQDSEVWIMEVDGSNRVKLFSAALMPDSRF